MPLGRRRHDCWPLNSQLFLQLASAAVALSRAALRELDLRQHDATHPRLGIVDHISCQPVGPEATLSDAANVAIRIGKVPSGGR